MSHSFNPARGLIIVQTRLWGTQGFTFARLALDTGATSTLINENLLLRLGYDPAMATSHESVTMGNGTVSVPRLPLDRIEALGQDRTLFPVLCHTLPLNAPVDGLLGLDFLRGQQLTIDFRAGLIDLV